MFPEAFKDWAWREMTEAKHVPVALAIACVVGFGFGWLAAGQFYAERIEILRQQVEGGKVLTVPTGAPPQPTVLFPHVPLWLGLAGATGVMGLLGLGWRNTRRLRTVNATLTTTKELLEDAGRDRQRLTIERDKAIGDLKATKNDYASAVLARYSNAKFSGDHQPKVTIRFSSYSAKDYDLVQQIETIFKSRVGWPVTLDGTNNPALRRAGEFKVLFDVGLTVLTYGDLLRAFADSDLLGVTVGQKQTEREDSHHLIVLVLPSD